MTANATLDHVGESTAADRVLPADIGLLALRVVFGLLFAGHGAQKLFGWFGGPGLAANNAGFEEMGYNPGDLFGTVAGLSELVGGLLLALGALSPLGAAIVLGTSLIIIHTMFDGGLLTGGEGYEMGVLFAAVAFTVAFTGPGRFSVDHRLPWARSGLLWGGAAVAAAVVTAGLTLALKVLL